jgi:hypothetical protein
MTATIESGSKSTIVQPVISDKTDLDGPRAGPQVRSSYYYRSVGIVLTIVNDRRLQWLGAAQHIQRTGGRNAIETRPRSHARPKKRRAKGARRQFAKEERLTNELRNRS